MDTYIFGLDIGYGYTKGKSVFGQWSIPSAVALAKTISFRSGLVERDDAVVEIEGTAYFVGDVASRQSRMTEQTLDPTRVGSREQLALFYGIALKALPVEVTNVHVVTGLPPAEFASQTYRPRLEKMLQGPHIIMQDGNRARAYHVTQVDVVPQPFGTIFSEALTDEGRMNGGAEDLMNDRLGIIDVGVGTIGFSLVDKLENIEDGMGSLGTGIGNAIYTDLAKAITREHDYDLTGQYGKLDQAIRDRFVTISGQRFPITKALDPLLESLAGKIASSCPFGDGKDLDAVLITGGGATVMEHYIRRKYKHARAVEEPQFANVRGFYRYGLLIAGE